MVLRGLDIAEGKQGCFAKTRSWLNDEGVLLHARGRISGAGDKVTTYRLAKAVGEYLDSQRAEEAIQGALIYGPGGNKIRVRTARRWLSMKEMSCVKNVYVLYVYCYIVVACIFFNCRDLSCYLYTAVW
jgi:hypothetical protein